MSWIRGGIRAGLWNEHPIKLEFLKKNRIKIPNMNPKSMERFPEVWGAKCALTGDIIPMNKVEVDHKTGNHSLKTVDDIAEFIKSIVLITEDDLQLVSKDAHKVKSYADAQGITFQEALLEKKVIAFRELPAKEQINILQNIYDVSIMKSLSNATKRANAYKQYLEGTNV